MTAGILLEAFSSRFEGDAVEIAGLRLTAARMDGPRIVQVGLLLPRLDAEGAWSAF